MSATCPKQVGNALWALRPCGLSAKYGHNGVMFCRMHHPPSAEARSDAVRAAKTTAISTQAAIEAEQKRRADCYPDLLAALRVIANTDPVDAALDPQRAVRVARVAITKATGEQT